MINALLAGEIADRLGENVSDLTIDTLYDNSVTTDSEFSVSVDETKGYKLFVSIGYKLSPSGNTTVKHGECTGYFSPDQFVNGRFDLNVQPLSALITGESFHLEIYGIR